MLLMVRDDQNRLLQPLLNSLLNWVMTSFAVDSTSKLQNTSKEYNPFVKFFVLTEAVRNPLLKFIFFVVFHSNYNLMVFLWNAFGEWLDYVYLQPFHE